MAVRLFRILYWACFVLGIFMGPLLVFTFGPMSDHNASIAQYTFALVLIPFVCFTPHLVVVVANYIFRGQWAFSPWHVR
jgi:hypothetical protein